MTILTIYNY